MENTKYKYRVEIYKYNDAERVPPIILHTDDVPTVAKRGMFTSIISGGEIIFSHDNELGPVDVVVSVAGMVTDDEVNVQSEAKEDAVGCKYEVWVVTVFLEGGNQPLTYAFDGEVGVESEGGPFLTFSNESQSVSHKTDKVDRFFVSRKEG